MTYPTDLVALPKGGGAQSGLGESFTPDLFTGTGNFTVPIAVPRGRNGFQPSLNLVYSTGRGNGIFGLGWGLSVPRIARKISDGVPSYDDAQDEFILSATTEELVPVEGAFPGVVRYRPRTEGLFARIDFHRDAESSFWDIRTRDGVRSLYGAPTGGPTVTRDPNASQVVGGIFAWHLSETIDPFGNRILYNYETESTVEGGHHGTQTYLRSIHYLDTPHAGAGAFLISVDFDYGRPGEIRPDPFSEYRAGFEVRTLRRCRRITTTTHLGDASPTRVYDFTYQDDLIALGLRPADSLPANGMSLLARIRATGLAGPGRGPDEPLPALDFSYSEYRPETRRFQRLIGDLPTQTLGNPRLELIDLNGNGLPDFLETNGIYRYWSNLGGGRFDLPRTMSEAPAGVALGQPGVSALDINGDGRLELAVAGPPLAGYYQLDMEGRFDRRGFRRIDAAPSFDTADPEVRLIDLDGDGVTDAVRSGSDFECFFADRERGWHRVIRRPRGVAGSFPDVRFADSRVRTADMTGDGLTDIVLIHDRNVEYWPNLGHGRFGDRVSMRNAPLLPRGYLPRQVLLGDVDGDGLHDLVFIDQSKVVVWFNQSGNRWSDPVEIGGTPRFTDESDVRLIDLLGVGTAGILWSDASGRGGRAEYRFLDLTGGTKPYLLTRTDNNMGAVTSVTYRSSCEDFLRDRQNPATRWQTTLPTPVQVVGSVAVIDHFSGNQIVAEYSYRHGHYDGEERSFVGFGRVNVRDAEFRLPHDAAGAAPFEGFDVHLRPPPTERCTWFDLGPVGPGQGDWREIDFETEYWTADAPGFPLLREQRRSIVQGLAFRRHRRDALRAMRGTILREELYALDGSAAAAAPYTIRETIRHVRPEFIPITADARPIFFPFEVATRTTQWDRGNDPLTTMQVSGDVDPFGQSRRSVSFACPRGWQGFAETRDDFLASMSVKTFAQRDDASRFMVDRPSMTEEFEVQSELDGAPARVEDLAMAALAGAATATLFSRVRNYFDGPAFEGLPLGQLGDFGALVRSEQLALTSAQLTTALEGAPDSSLPPYLDPAAPEVWPDVYPEAFRTATGPTAGYTLESATGGTAYYVQTERRSYDFQEPGPRPAVGLVARMLDPRGHETQVTYDDLLLFPAQIVGPTGLSMAVIHDYRAMQPARVVEPNGNPTEYGYTPLGLLASVATMGPEGTNLGDTSDAPSQRYVYNLVAFENSPAEGRQAISVTTFQRHYQINGPFDDDVPRDRTTTTIEHSDGFGRLLQTRANAESTVFGNDAFGEGSGLPEDQALAPQPATPVTVLDRVRVSGAVTYDGKGRAVETFEPYFDVGLAYAPPSALQVGRRNQVFYDPVGRQVRTRSSNGSEAWTVLGIPTSLDTPSDFSPSPWESYQYDANDLAPISRSSEDGLTLGAAAPADHAFTPSSIEIDALGRTIRAVQRLGAGADAEVTTRTRYDIRGNQLEVTDALGRVAFRCQYDHLNRALRTDSIDAGMSLGLMDAGSLPVEQRDAKGAQGLTASDEVGRTIGVWSRDRADLPITRRQHLIYGDTATPGILSHDTARSRNLLGRIFQHYDGAGRATAVAHDHKGNLIEAVREVFSDATLLAALDAPVEDFQVDWTVDPDESLDSLAAARLASTAYRTSTVYDALDRPIRLDGPEDVEGQRHRLNMRYAISGALESMTLDGTPVVRHVAYDAKGQRTLIAYGNGVMTRYAYDRRSLRLRRLRSERFTDPSEMTFLPSGPPLQDFAYVRDLLGEILEMSDRTRQSGVQNNPESAVTADPALAQLLSGGNALIRRFTYDPLYRLTSATGREHDRPADDRPWVDTPKTTDFTRTRTYTERYTYDVVGNLEELHHLAGATASFTRTFTLEPGSTPGIAASNRLQRLSVGESDIDYAYDPAGNMLSEETSRSFHWNCSNQLKGFRVQAGAGPASVAALYLYGADGSRVKKLVRRQGGVQSVTTVGGFEHTREDGTENDVLDISDGAARVASIRIGPALPGDTTPARQHYLTDHLGSINVTVDTDGGIIDREEVLPYGETTFGSVARKRWRFTGQRRDEESGLSRHGARHYAPWLARWTSTDPAGPVDGPNLFRYARSNPINFSDESGLAPSAGGETPMSSGVNQCRDNESLGGYVGRIAAAREHGENINVAAAKSYLDMLNEAESPRMPTHNDGPSMSATTATAAHQSQLALQQHDRNNELFLQGNNLLRSSPTAWIGYGLAKQFTDDKEILVLSMAAADTAGSVAMARAGRAGLSRRSGSPSAGSFHLGSAGYQGQFTTGKSMYNQATDLEAAIKNCVGCLRSVLEYMHTGTLKPQGNAVPVNFGDVMMAKAHIENHVKGVTLLPGMGPAIASELPMQDGFYAVFTNARKATVNGQTAYVADHALLGVRLGRLQFFFNPQADQIGGDMQTANPGPNFINFRVSFGRK